MAANCLVIGYGSIGKRHVGILQSLGCRTAVVSRHSSDVEPVYRTIADAFSVEVPEYVVVANETVDHYETLTRLAAAGFSGTILVEKPLFDRMRPLPQNEFGKVYVGFHYRMHPVLAALKAELDEDRPVSAQIYVGQYLPDWRPGTDYRQSYSASIERGGGALRDLSHELDYACWLFGPWTHLTAIGGHLSALDIASDDCWSVLAAFERCPAVTIQLNYLDRKARREFIVNTHDHSFKGDLIAGRLERDSRVRQFDVDRDDWHRGLHVAALSQRDDDLCSLAEGLSILKMTEAVERAARDRAWVGS